MNKKPTAADFQVVFGPVPKPFPSELWKNRASIFLMDDANTDDIGFDGRPLSVILKEEFPKPQEIRAYRVAGLQLGPVLYDIPAGSGMFVAIRPNASNPALSICEVFLDHTAEGAKPQFSSWLASVKKFGRIDLSWICLMAVFISGKLDVKMPEEETGKLKAACQVVHDYLCITPTKTPLWAFVTTMALVMVAKGEAHPEDEVLQAIAYAYGVYDRHMSNMKQTNPTEPLVVASTFIGNPHYEAFQLDDSPAPRGVLVC